MNINLDALKNIKVEDLVANLKEYFSSSKGLLKDADFMNFYYDFF